MLGIPFSAFILRFQLQGTLLSLPSVDAILLRSSYLLFVLLLAIRASVTHADKASAWYPYLSQMIVALVTQNRAHLPVASSPVCQHGQLFRVRVSKYLACLIDPSLRR